MANYGYKVKKNRNIMTFERTDYDTGKNAIYQFDINTATMINANARTPKPLDAMPAGLSRYLENHYKDNFILMLMYTMRDRYWEFNNSHTALQPRDMRHFATLFQTVDKIASLNNTINVDSRWDFNPENLNFINENFKRFAEYVRTTENPSISNFRRMYAFEIWMAKNHITIDEHFTEEMANFLYMNKNSIDKKYFPYVIYYLSRGLWDFYRYTTGSINTARVLTSLTEYFQMCEQMEIQPEKGDFYRIYINTCRNYHMRKQEIDMKAIQRQYDKHRNALTFEDDNFVVVIPTTSKDFENEGNAQSNCVFSIYLDKVRNGNTNVVFVRRKSAPKTSYITCEVSNNGGINQYLEKYNRWVNDNDALAFRKAYQEHLTRNWDLG